jgi:hypothetical protein
MLISGKFQFWPQLDAVRRNAPGRPSLFRSGKCSLRIFPPFREFRRYIIAGLILPAMNLWNSAARSTRISNDTLAKSRLGYHPDLNPLLPQPKQQ